MDIQLKTPISKEQFQEFCQRKPLSQATLSNYQQYIGSRFLPWLEEQDNPEVNDDLLRSYAQWVFSVTRSQSTARTHLSVVLAFIRFCEIPITVTVRKLGASKAQPRQRFFSKKEVIRLVHYAKRDPQEHLLASIGLLMGLRRKEMACLRYSDFDGDLLPILNGKGGKARSVPIPTAIRRIVKRHRRKSNSPYLFSSQKNGHALTGHTLTKIWQGFMRDAAEDLGIEYGCLHTCRHTAATHWVMAGVDLRTVQSWLGHANLQTTETYLKSSVSHRMDSMDRFEAWFKSHTR